MGHLPSLAARRAGQARLQARKHRVSMSTKPILNVEVFCRIRLCIRPSPTITTHDSSTRERENDLRLPSRARLTPTSPSAAASALARHDSRCNDSDHDGASAIAGGECAAIRPQTALKTAGIVLRPHNSPRNHVQRCQCASWEWEWTWSGSHGTAEQLCQWIEQAQAQ